LWNSFPNLPHFSFIFWILVFQSNMDRLAWFFLFLQKGVCLLLLLILWLTMWLTSIEEMLKEQSSEWFMTYMTLMVDTSTFLLLFLTHIVSHYVRDKSRLIPFNMIGHIWVNSTHNLHCTIGKLANFWLFFEAFWRFFQVKKSLWITKLTVANIIVFLSNTLKHYIYHKFSQYAMMSQ